MKWQGLGVSPFTALAGWSLGLAVATVGQFRPNPVPVGNAVNEGEITPLVRNLAQVLFEALRGILKYL